MTKLKCYWDTKGVLDPNYVLEGEESDLLLRCIISDGHDYEKLEHEMRAKTTFAWDPQQISGDLTKIIYRPTLIERRLTPEDRFEWYYDGAHIHLRCEAEFYLDIRPGFTVEDIEEWHQEHSLDHGCFFDPWSFCFTEDSFVIAEEFVAL